MKRTLFPLALAVMLAVTLMACSSKPAQPNNNGTASSSPRPTTPSTNVPSVDSGSGSGSTIPDNSVIDEDIMDDDIMDGDIIDDGIVEDEYADDDLVDVDPVAPEARTRTANVRGRGDYCADCNGNLVDWEDSQTIGDAARTAVDGVMNGVRRAGTAVGDTLKGDR